MINDDVKREIDFNVFLGQTKNTSENTIKRVIIKLLFDKISNKSEIKDKDNILKLVELYNEEHIPKDYVKQINTIKSVVDSQLSDAELKDKAENILNKYKINVDNPNINNTKIIKNNNIDVKTYNQFKNDVESLIDPNVKIRRYTGGKYKKKTRKIHKI